MIATKDILLELYNGCYQWQKEALKAIKENHGSGIIVAPTGSGKTRPSILMILKAACEFKKVLIVVPTKVLMNQWYDAINQTSGNDFDIGVNKIYGETKHHNPTFEVDIAVVNSIREKALDYDLVILDECHRYCSEENIDFLYDLVNPDTNIIGLTATLTRPDGRHRLLLDIVPIVYKYTVEKAKRDKVVNEYEIKNIELQFSEDEQARYNILNEMVKDGLKVFGGNFNKAIEAIKSGEGKEIGQGSHLLRAVQGRKKLVFSCEDRITKAIRLIKFHQEDKVIVFSENIQSIERIEEVLNGEGIVTTIYHSKKKKRQEEIERFNNGESNIMLSAKALDEGYDIKNANVAIVISGSSSRRQIIQRLGRVIRINEGKGKSLLYQLFVPGTVEEKWVVKRLIA